MPTALSHWLGNIWKSWWGNKSWSSQAALLPCSLWENGFQFVCQTPWSTHWYLVQVWTLMCHKVGAKLCVLVNVPWTALGVLCDGKTHLQTSKDALNQSKVKTKSGFLSIMLLWSGITKEKLLKRNSYQGQGPGLIPPKDRAVNLALQEILESSEYQSVMPPWKGFQKSSSPFCVVSEEQFLRSFFKCQNFPRSGNSHFQLALSAASAFFPGQQAQRKGTTRALSPGAGISKRVIFYMQSNSSSCHSREGELVKIHNYFAPGADYKS